MLENVELMMPVILFTRPQNKGGFTVICEFLQVKSLLFRTEFPLKGQIKTFLHKMYDVCSCDCAI